MNVRTPELLAAELGSISMTCYGAGTGIRLAEEKPCCAAGLPEGVPADQTNI